MQTFGSLCCYFDAAPDSDIVLFGAEKTSRLHRAPSQKRDVDRDVADEDSEEEHSAVA